jgi:hypothetical protein
VPTPNDPLTPIAGDDSPQTTSKAAELRQRAAEAIDAKRDAVANKIESAAFSLRERAETMPGGERLAGAADSAAGAMQSAADYVRDHDVEEMLSDIQRTVKRHPGAALLTAAAVGFVIARALTRR